MPPERNRKSFAQQSGSIRVRVRSRPADRLEKRRLFDPSREDEYRV